MEAGTEEGVKPKWLDVGDGTSVMRVPGGMIVNTTLGVIEGVNGSSGETPGALASASVFVPCSPAEVISFLNGNMQAHFDDILAKTRSKA
jgi:hypothetical protein